MAKEKIVYMIQCRYIAGFEAHTWEDAPHPPVTDFYAAIAARDQIKGYMDKSISPPPGAGGASVEFTNIVREAIKDAGIKVELRIVKRTMVDEVVDDAERVL